MNNSDEKNKFGGGQYEDRGRGGRDRGGRGGDDRFGGDEMDGMGFDGPGLKEGGYDIEKDRRMFSRKKSCWFCAKKSQPDWKDANSYNWLINEFGKISPARITGLCACHQRRATSAIKRGRNMGMISYVSNYGAH